MKKFILFMTMTILVISCNTEKEEGISYNATVLGKGLDCGETFLIQFNDNTDNLNSNNLDNIFYAINLSNEYKIDCNAGDLVVFSGCHLHGTIPNISNKTRFGLFTHTHPTWYIGLHSD